MLGPEVFLPEEAQFNVALADVREVLVDTLIDHLRRGGELVDCEKELSREAELSRVSRGVAELISISGENDRDVQAVVYRSMAFAMQVLDGIANNPLGDLPTEYIGEAQQTLDPAETIAKDTREYFSTRPHIASLVYTFSPHLDPSYDYHHHVVTATGLMFMLAERNIAEEYLRVQLDILDITQLEKGE